MNITPAETRQRHGFVERTLESALEICTTPEVARGLGRSAVRFSNILSSAVIANIVHGEVRLPDSYIDDVGALPVVAVWPDEKFVMSEEFDTQTYAQRQKTLRTFQSWEPISETAQALYEARFSGSGRKSPPVTVGGLVVAMTGTSVGILDMQRFASDSFYKAPSKGIGLFRRRPALILKMLPNTRQTPNHAVVHELVHAVQLEACPIEVVHSQKSVDMMELRKEIEAYHAGSIVAALARVNNGSQGDPNDPSQELANVQLAVEVVRQQHGIDEYDPYRPSPALLRKLEAKSLGAILHGRMRYEDLVALAENHGQVRS